MVQHLIAYFEGVSSMDSKKGKKKGRKIAAEANSSRVKRLINDITEIKRPPGKQKTSVDCNIADKYKIFYRNNTKMEFKTTNTNVKSEHKNDESPLLSLNKKCDDIERKVQEFGENLRRKREELQQGDAQVNVYATHSETTTYVYNLSHSELEVSSEEENIISQNVEKNDMKNEDSEKIINYAGAVKKENTISNKEKIEEREKRDKSVRYRIDENTSNKIDDDDGDDTDDGDDDDVFESEGSMEDFFGFNEFDENQTDNYIIETYNRNGGELFIITLQITRQTVLQNNFGNFPQEDDFDYIFHQNEYYTDSRTGTDENDNGSSDCISQHVIRSNYETDVQSIVSSSNSTDFLEINNNYPNHYTQESNNCYEEIDYSKNNSENEHSGTSGKAGGITHLEERPEEADNFYHNLATVTDVPDYIDIQTSNKISERGERITYIIQEIIETERKYISVMKKVVEKYIPYIEAHTPQGLIGKTSYLFGNFVQIYENSKGFLKSLENSSRDPDSIARVFIDSASEFELYPLYSKNKPTADIYLTHFKDVVLRVQKREEDKLGLASHLLTPIQRLGKYVLLLEQIRKELDKMDKPSEHICEAMKIIKKVMKRGNDYIAIDSIKGSTIDLALMGSFIMRACFNILKPKKFTSMVFLFDQIIVFTEKVTKTAEHFKFVDCIEMSDLSLGKFEEKPTIFHLTNYAKAKRSHPDATFVLEAENSKMKNDWTTAIGNKLWLQLEKAKEQQKKLGVTHDRHVPKASTIPRYSKRVSKNSKLHRSISKSKSRFYSTDAT